jgi:hypothetical protein
MDDPTGYVADAIRRLSANEVLGSHAAGVYNRAANAFEKEIASFVTALDPSADTEKLTLGQLIHLLQAMKGAKAKPLVDIITSARRVNARWRKVKHGDDPPSAALLDGLQAMRDVLLLLKPKSASTAVT